MCIPCMLHVYMLCVGCVYCRSIVCMCVVCVFVYVVCCVCVCFEHALCVF